MKIKYTLTVAAMALLSSAMVASAQQGGGNGGGGPGGGGGGRGNRGGGGGNWDPAQMMQRMEERLKTELKASDEEWTVMQPLLEKVVTAQREAGAGGMGGRGMMGGGRGGPGGPGGAPQGGGPGGPGGPGGGSPEVQALRTTLDNESAAPADIQAKLAAVRAARKKGQTDLASARDNLKKVLTQRQEAVLVMTGLLE